MPVDNKNGTEIFCQRQKIKASKILTIIKRKHGGTKK